MFNNLAGQGAFKSLPYTLRFHLPVAFNQARQPTGNYFVIPVKTGIQIISFQILDSRSRRE